MKNINIEDFKDIEVKIDFEPIMDKYSKKAKDILINESPKSGRPNRATPYALGWTVNSDKDRQGIKKVVWNETNWQLTHLLENGHFITNVKRPGGLLWAAPRKHIKNAYLSIRGGYIRAMKKAKVKAEFK